MTTPATASYNFSSNKDVSACQDGVTGVNLTFPWTLALPARAQATITAIALLTVPAASDADVHSMYADVATNNDAFVPGYLWDHVYGMYGYDGTKMGVSRWLPAFEEFQCVFELTAVEPNSMLWPLDDRCFAHLYAAMQP